jgi:hypothetical protein
MPDDGGKFPRYHLLVERQHRRPRPDNGIKQLNVKGGIAHEHRYPVTLADSMFTEGFRPTRHPDEQLPVSYAFPVRDYCDAIGMDAGVTGQDVMDEQD